MRIELLTAREQLAGIAGAWDELARGDARDGFFRTWGWYDAWMRHVRPEAAPFVAVAREDSGAVAGIAPLCRAPYRDLGFRLGGVMFGGREVVSGDFLDFPARPERRAAVLAEMARFLLEDARAAGLLVFGELLDGGDTLAALEEAARQREIPVRRQEERICPCIALPGSFEAYLTGLGSSTRYHIRRRMRDAARAGAEVRTLSAPEEIAAGLETLVRLHLARWKRDDQPGTLGRAGFGGFLREIFRHPPAGSAARLYLLLHGGAECGALLAFRFGESTLYYQAGWDPESPLAELSPGVVLMAHSIRDAIESGCRYYEFLRGGEAYKSRWTGQFRRTVTLLAGRGMLAREYLRIANVKDAVKQSLGGRRPAASLPA